MNTRGRYQQNAWLNTRSMNTFHEDVCILSIIHDNLRDENEQESERDEERGGEVHITSSISFTCRVITALVCSAGKHFWQLYFWEPDWWRPPPSSSPSCPLKYRYEHAGRYSFPALILINTLVMYNNFTAGWSWGSILSHELGQTVSSKWSPTGWAVNLFKSRSLTSYWQLSRDASKLCHDICNFPAV
jgi:hypothetical protein